MKLSTELVADQRFLRQQALGAEREGFSGQDVGAVWNFGEGILRNPNWGRSDALATFRLVPPCEKKSDL